MRDCELSHIAFVQWEAPLTNCRPTTEGVRVDGHVIRKKYQMGGGNEGNVYHFYLSLNLIGSSRDFNACFQSGMLEILICAYIISIHFGIPGHQTSFRNAQEIIAIMVFFVQYLTEVGFLQTPMLLALAPISNSRYL